MASPRSVGGGGVAGDEAIWRKLREAGFDEDAVRRRDKAALIGYISRLESEVIRCAGGAGFLVSWLGGEWFLATRCSPCPRRGFFCGEFRRIIGYRICESNVEILSAGRGGKISFSVFLSPSIFFAFFGVYFGDYWSRWVAEAYENCHFLVGDWYCCFRSGTYCHCSLISWL